MSRQTAQRRVSGNAKRNGENRGRLYLVEPRSRASAELDKKTPIKFLRWAAFIRDFDWQQGEHITLVGTTNSGKTTLARELLPLRDYVVVLATKPRDSSLYDPLVKKGYVIESSFDPTAEDGNKVIFRPPLDAPTSEAIEEQSDKFRDALIEIFRAGAWCVYADEVRYLTDNLHLKREFETLWLQGRSLGVSLVVGTQRPVSIPLLAFDSATHLFLWRNTDYRNINRMAEFSGTDEDMVRETIPQLPQHEVLYINTRTGNIVRTNVRS